MCSRAAEGFPARIALPWGLTWFRALSWEQVWGQCGGLLLFGSLLADASPLSSSRSFMGLWRFQTTTTTTKLCKTYKKGKLQATQTSEVALSFREGFRIFHGLVPVCLVELSVDFIVAPSS